MNLPSVKGWVCRSHVTAGEREVTDPTLFNGTLQVTTYKPNASSCVGGTAVPGTWCSTTPPAAQRTLPQFDWYGDGAINIHDLYMGQTVAGIVARYVLRGGPQDGHHGRPGGVYTTTGAAEVGRSVRWRELRPQYTQRRCARPRRLAGDPLMKRHPLQMMRILAAATVADRCLRRTRVGEQGGAGAGQRAGHGGQRHGRGDDQWPDVSDQSQQPRLPGDSGRSRGRSDRAGAEWAGGVTRRRRSSASSLARAPSRRRTEARS